MKLRKKKSIPSINLQETPSRKRTNKSTPPSKSQQNRSENVAETSRNMVGVTKRKTGNYGVKIHDRIRKKDVWLGTFGSEEEASKVYWAKKNELEKEFEGLAKNVDTVDRDKKTSQFVGVSLRASGKFAAHIRDPIRKKKLYLGAFDSEKKASEVYLAKKKELEEEVKGNGVHWHLGRREGKRGTSLMIRKRRNFGEEIEKRRNFGEVIEKRRNSGEEIQKRRKIVKCGEFSEDDYNDDDQESSMEIEYMDSSAGEGASTETGTSENSSILEVSNGDDIQSLKESDHNDSWNGESGPSKARVAERNSTILEEKPCSENQESLKEDINHSDAIHQDNVPVEAKPSNHDLGTEKNAAETEVIKIDSIAQALIVNPCPGRISGATILLRTKSGTPLMDSNGFLLGEWSYLDDMSLPSRM